MNGYLESLFSLKGQVAIITGDNRQVGQAIASQLGIDRVLAEVLPQQKAEEIKKLRGGALKHTVETRIKEELSEIILAFSVNPDGENTGRYVESILKDIITEHNITISYLGRGLSTGSELEYADPDTISSLGELPENNAILTNFLHEAAV